MTKTKTIPASKLLTTANHVPHWDESGQEAAARKPVADAASDFVFNEPSDAAEQSQPSKSDAKPTAAPTPVSNAPGATTATERVQTAAVSAAPRPPEVAKSPVKRLVAWLHNDKEQPGLKCSPELRQKFEAAQIWPDAAPSREPSCPLLKRVVKSSPVKTALASAKAERETYLKVCADTFPLTEIELQKLALRKAIDAASDVAEITKLRDDAILLDSPEAGAARNSALRLVKTAHLKLEAVLGQLVGVASVELQKLAPKIKESETTLFADWGFPHHTTPLTLKLRALQARVEQHKQYLETRTQPINVSANVSGDGSHIISTFED